MAEIAEKGQNPLTCGFVIADARGETLMEVPFLEMLGGHVEAPRCHLFDRARPLPLIAAVGCRAAGPMRGAGHQPRGNRTLGDKRLVSKGG